MDNKRICPVTNTIYSVCGWSIKIKSRPPNSELHQILIDFPNSFIGTLAVLLQLDSTGYDTLPSPPRLMRRTYTQRNSVTDGLQATQYLLRSLNDGEGNKVSQSDIKNHNTAQTPRYTTLLILVFKTGCKWSSG